MERSVLDRFVGSLELKFSGTGTHGKKKKCHGKHDQTGHMVVHFQAGTSQSR